MDGPKSDHERWNRTAAFIGAVIVSIISSTVIVAIIWQLAVSHTQGQIKNERYSTHYAESASKQIQESCNSPDLDVQRECIEKIVTSTHEQQRNESDVQAQWQMADWAYAMVIISGFSFLATIAGIFFVRENLLEMQKTSELSREAIQVAKNEQRAWLAVALSDAQPHRHSSEKVAGVKFKFAITNMGSQPAFSVHLYAKLFWSDIAFASSEAAEYFIPKAIEAAKSSGRTVYPALPYKGGYEMMSFITPPLGRIWNEMPPLCFFALIVTYRTAGDTTIRHNAEIHGTSPFVTSEGVSIFLPIGGERIS
jgi:hypothetical protein